MPMLQTMAAIAYMNGIECVAVNEVHIDLLLNHSSDGLTFADELPCLDRLWHIKKYPSI